MWTVDTDTGGAARAGKNTGGGNQKKDTGWDNQKKNTGMGHQKDTGGGVPAWLDSVLGDGAAGNNTGGGSSSRENAGGQLLSIGNTRGGPTLTLSLEKVFPAIWPSLLVLRVE